MADWLQVSVITDGEMAEAIADALAPFGHQGIAIESTFVSTEKDEDDPPVGPLQVRAFVPLELDGESLRNRIEQALWPFAMIARDQGLPAPTPHYTVVADSDWANLWKDRYKPVRVGQRIHIIPAWLNPPLAPGDIDIRIEPGLAFGTGAHPTTQLSLAAIERYLEPGQRVLDMGCGSGILSIAAAKLGAARVDGFDTDVESIAIATENAAFNGVAGKVTNAAGSVAEARAGGEYDLVVANILASIINALLDDGLIDLVRPGGRLIISGVMTHQADDMRARLTQSGIQSLETTTQGDWVAISGVRP